MDVDADHRARLQRALGPEFELGRCIAFGTGRDTFAGFDRTLQRPVTVKASRGNVGPAYTLVFQQREAGILRLLPTHPSLLTTYDSFVRDNVAFVIASPIDGMTLEAMLMRDGRISARSALRIGADIARALGAIHASGILHQSVEPGNIFVPDQTRPAVLDGFAFARTIESLRETQQSHVVGVLKYMGPERFSPDSRVDERSDIYMLGAVMYELLTGKPPVSADTFREHVTRLLSSAPASIPLLPDVPKRAADAVMRALARNPDDRWPDAAAFANELAG